MTIHISSLVAQVFPVQLAQLCQALSDYPGLEIHGSHPAGKVVITLETQSEGAILEAIEYISTLPGVLAANLVFHHVEHPGSDLPVEEKE